MHALAYRRYLSGLVEKTTSEDNILLMAKKLVKAKDESGLNLFWDEDEETMLRVYIEHAEMIAEC